MQLPSIRNKLGFSLIEITFGLLISSIIISTTYKANNYFNKSAMRENTKAVIQKDIFTITDFITKDIRMAGLSLPGNGIKATISDVSNDQLQIFINDKGGECSLLKILQYSDSVVLVTNADNMQANGWICIADTIDTIYRQINKVSMGVSDTDTVFLATRMLAGPFKLSGKAYPASRIVYYVDAENKGLHRKRNNLDVRLASNLDVFKAVPKDASGTALGGDGKDADVLSIVIGAELGSGNEKVIVADSIEVNIRNGS